MPTALEIAQKNADESRERAAAIMRERFSEVVTIFEDLKSAGLEPKLRYASQGENEIDRRGMMKTWNLVKPSQLPGDAYVKPVKKKPAHR